MNATTIRKPRALLLDDDPVVLRLLGTALEARGFDVRAARDGDTGLELLIDELLDLDVLVADADLPGRDGVSLLHLVRHAGGERDLAVVVLANPAPRGVRAQLLALGADAVVDRAIGHEATATVIEAAVRARALALAPRPAPAMGRPALQGMLLVVREAFASQARLAITAG
jgi:CheY-like chemotaxis protein